jgi:hypothetical protein
MTKSKEGAVTTDTIDALIRRKAASRLKQELGALFQPIRDRVGQKSLSLPRYKDESGRGTTIRGALDEIEATMFKSEVAEYEQSGILEFLAKHDEVQTKLNELLAEVKDEQ